MEIEFDLTPEDILAFARFLQRRRHPRPAARWLWVVLLSLFLLSLFLLKLVVATVKGTVSIDEFLPGIGLMVLLPLVVFLLFKALTRLSHKQLLKDARNQWVFATRRVTLSPEELSITSWPFRASYRWGVIWEIGVTVDHVFFCVTSIEASILPRRAFRDQQHFEEFVALARRYKEGTPTSTAITATPPLLTTYTSAPE